MCLHNLRRIFTITHIAKQRQSNTDCSRASFTAIRNTTIYTQQRRHSMGKDNLHGWIPIEHAPKDIWVLGWIVADTPAYTPRARMMAWDKDCWYIPGDMSVVYPTHYKLVDITPPNNKWSR